MGIVLRGDRPRFLPRRNNEFAPVISTNHESQVSNYQSLLWLALYVGLWNVLRVNQLQRQVFRLPGPQRDVLLPSGKNSLSRRPDVIVVRLQLRNREMPMRVRVHCVRPAAARRLVGHARVCHRPVIRSQHHAAQRGGSFSLRRGRYAACSDQRQQKNRNQYQCASHFFHP